MIMIIYFIFDFIISFGFERSNKKIIKIKTFYHQFSKGSEQYLYVLKVIESHLIDKDIHLLYQIQQVLGPKTK